MRALRVIRDWMTPATWSELVSIITMWLLPLMLIFGRSMNSTIPPID